MNTIDWNDCARLAEAADKMLALAGDLRVLRSVNPSEARKVATQIELFEKRFTKFLAETAETPKLREKAKAMLAELDSARARFNITGPRQVQADALEKKFSKYLADTEEVPRQRDVVEEALLKFAAARSQLNGESGN
ncbi:hypothetical protein [Candidatus Binatus sp.]|uniref:hypothetical protein n=1 Tax=Candidatus Binatus sp. TaxID=2811406 RepID=UPI003CBDCDCD